MARQNVEKLSFNRGLISPLALARADVKRVGLAAETQVNWMPRVLGPMSLRPGWEYTGNTYTNAAARQLPFIFALDDTATLEFTDSILRVWVDDVLVTRPSVSTAFTNGTFDTNLTGWTDADEGTTPTSVWRTGGYMDLLGDGTNAAIRKQTLTIAGGDQNVEHAINIVVAQGEVKLRVGSTDGGDEYITEATLTKGYHSLSFTPTGASVYVRLFNRNTYNSLVDSCVIASSGVMTLTTPYTASNLNDLRYDQSGDVVFIACKGKRRSRVERRSDTSWSIVDYFETNGPFRSANVTPTTITPSAITGEITLTASTPTFRSTNVGGQYQVTSTGQTVSKSLGAANVWSDPIRVTGLTATRGITINITGTWVATVTLQRSVGDVGNWTDVTTYTANQTSLVYNDSLDNQEIYYRIGIDTGDYTSGTAGASLYYPFGSITGVVRVTAYTSTTVVTGIVIQDLGAATATSDWAEGAWSDRRGHPSSVALHEGRLWWAGKDRIVGSVSDAYTDYDPDYEGDAGPINRTIGSGPVDTVNWLFSGQRLLLGAQLAEKIVKSSALDEPVTPSNFNMKDVSTYGSANVDVIKIDGDAAFVDRSGSRLMALTNDPTNVNSAQVSDLTIIVPEALHPYVVRTAVQRRPDTRVHCVLSDGTVAILVFDKAEDVKCWCTVNTDGTIEDVVILPGAIGDDEDQVYYTVARSINGSTVRFREKWALESECAGGTDNRQADAFYRWTGASSTTITGLTHLVGESVVCWANGKDQGTFTVSGAGEITLLEAATSATVGLTYRARYKSTKLAYAAQGGSALTQVKRVDHLGLILYNTHYQGLQYGPDFDNLDALPLIEDGKATAADTVWSTYDELSFEFDGTYDTDSRICLQADAPRPATVMAAVISMTTHEKL